MKPVDTDILTLCRENLWYDIDELRNRSLPQPTIERIVRLRTVYNWWLQYPTKREKDVVDELVGHYKLNRTYAYKDLAVLRNLLGDLGKVTKDFIRFQFNNMVMEAYTKAKERGDAAAMVAAADKYAKYNQLDKVEELSMHWELLHPQQFQITDDPSVIGFKPIPDIRNRIKKKIAQYWNDNVAEVRYVESLAATDNDTAAQEIL